MGPDAAFMGYTAGRPCDSSARVPEPPVGGFSRAVELLCRNPGLVIVGPSRSTTRGWEAWLWGTEIEEARHERFGPFAAYLEAREDLSPKGEENISQ